MEKRITADIIKASESIRKKHKLLKQGLIEEENLSKKRFEPLLKPIETLIDLTTEKKVGSDRGVDAGVRKEKIKSPKFKKEKIDPSLKSLGIKRLRTKVVKKTKKKLDTNIQTGEPGVEEVQTPYHTPKASRTPSYREEIFETPEAAKTAWDEWVEDTQVYGPLTRKYLNAQALDTKNRFDSRFGVRVDPNSKNWLMGNKIIDFDNQDFIHVGDQMFRGTVGLFELLFKKLPDTKVLTNYDKEVYKKILDLTSAHYQLYNPNLQIASSSGKKYQSIIKELFRGDKKLVKRGSNLIPVTDNKIDYIYWDDPNELVDRLYLLKSSTQAGNNSH